MDWRCDLYVFEHADGGVQIGVATNRRVIPDEWESPSVAELTTISVDDKDALSDWSIRYDRAKDELEAFPVVPLDHPHAGHWEIHDYGEAADFLEQLRADGLIFPEGIEQEIRQLAEDR